MSRLAGERGTVILELVAALLITGLPVAVLGGSVVATIDDVDKAVGIVIGAFAIWKAVLSPLQKMERRSRHTPWIVASIKRHDEALGLKPLDNPADEV